MADEKPPNGSASIRLPGGVGGEVKGSWGAIIILVATALLTMLGGIAYAGWVFNQTLAASQKSHDAMLTLLVDIREQGRQSQCINSLPIGEPRIAALRSDNPCDYALYIYVPANGAPLPSARPNRPKGLEERPPAAMGSPDHPTYPVNNVPTTKP